LIHVFFTHGELILLPFKKINNFGPRGILSFQTTCVVKLRWYLERKKSLNLHKKSFPSLVLKFMTALLKNWSYPLVSIFIYFCHCYFNYYLFCFYYFFKFIFIPISTLDILFHLVFASKLIIIFLIYLFCVLPFF